MRDDHNRSAGFVGFVMVGVFVAGAAGQVTGDEPARTAVADVRPQLVQTASVEALPDNGSETLMASAAGGCDGIVVGATEMVFWDGFETGDAGSWGPGSLARFSASRMLDLEFAIRFTEGFVGDHVLRLKLLTPKGHHYQTVSVPITSSAKRQGSTRRVDGYPRPLAIRALKMAATSSLPEVNVSVPVGGTPIVTSSIHGTWTAEAYLDDESEACASQPFVLTP